MCTVKMRNGSASSYRSWHEYEIPYLNVVWYFGDAFASTLPAFSAVQCNDYKEMVFNVM